MTAGVVLDVVGQGRGLAVSRFQSKPRVLGSIGASLAPAQALEFEGAKLRYLRSLDFADGAQLDGLGDSLSLPRAGRTDAVYRDALRTAVLRNTCDGTPDAIIRYVMSMNGFLPVYYAEGDGGFSLENRGVSVPGLPQLVRDVAPAGCGPIVVSQAPDGAVTI